MSTYYHFYCSKCDRRGGMFTRQAWGWGNFDIIESFKFLAYHTRECGEEYIAVHSEHRELGTDETLEPGDFERFAEKTRGIMPHSNDWNLVSTTPWEDVEAEWERKHRER